MRTEGRRVTAFPETDSADLLAAFPAARTEIRIGHARVSTRGQNLDRQTDMLTAAGCRRIFADKKSGKTAQRPELEACHAFLTAGDTLVVPDLARYGRSLKDLVTMVGELRREIGFTSCTNGSTQPHPATAWSSTYSLRSRNSSASSS